MSEDKLIENRVFTSRLCLYYHPCIGHDSYSNRSSPFQNFGFGARTSLPCRAVLNDLRDTSSSLLVLTLKGKEKHKPNVEFKVEVHDVWVCMRRGRPEWVGKKLEHV